MACCLYNSTVSIRWLILRYKWLIIRRRNHIERLAYINIAHTMSPLSSWQRYILGWKSSHEGDPLVTVNTHSCLQVIIAWNQSLSYCVLIGRTHMSNMQRYNCYIHKWRAAQSAEKLVACYCKIVCIYVKWLQHYCVGHIMTGQQLATNSCTINNKSCTLT
jgi:hypothetical protein